MDKNTQVERLAHTVMEQALGIQLEPHDDNSRNSMFDLKFTYPDGRTAAAEVVSNRQPALRKTRDQTRKVGYQEHSDLTRVWSVWVHHGSNPMKLKNRLHELLLHAEAQGRDQLSEMDLYDMYDEPESDWGDVSSASSRPPTPKYQPGFEIVLGAWSGWNGDGDDALAYVEGMLVGEWADVTAKLASSGRDETHAVIVLFDDLIGPKWAIDDGKTPTRVPDLPAGIDGLWMVSAAIPGRSVYCVPGQQWQEIRVTPQDYVAVCARHPG